MESIDFLVRVSCMTYNHAPYIVEAMNGFTMQQTSFPFVCIIVDDASTDGEPEVISNYMRENFDLADKTIAIEEETDDYRLMFARHKSNLNCYFVAVLLKYNHYSINKPKHPYYMRWVGAKYIAMCEGDDYWIAPDKLQEQVIYLENHLDYTMACNRTQLLSVKQNKMIGENYCYDKSRDIDPKDVINRSGLFISTCGIVYRKEIIQNIPDYWKNCLVYDYPLQIACALRGKTYYFNEMMSVYRVENPNSWVGQQQWGEVTTKRLKITKTMIEMFMGFAKDHPMYESVFMSKVASYINSGIPNRRKPWKERRLYISFFSDYIRNYSLFWKIDLWITMLGIPKIQGLYIRFSRRKYHPRKLLYQT